MSFHSEYPLATMVNYKGGQYRVDTSIYLLFIFYFGKEYKLIKNKI